MKLSQVVLAMAAAMLSASCAGDGSQADMPSPDQYAEDVQPIERVRPRYPLQAIKQRASGYVIFEFTITETGEVSDISVKESMPPGLFDKEAARALARWKFKLKLVDGKPVPRRAVQRINFDLGRN